MSAKIESFDRTCFGKISSLYVAMKLIVHCYGLPWTRKNKAATLALHRLQPSLQRTF